MVGGRVAGCTLEEAGDLAELPGDLLDHLVRSLADGLHRHGREPVGDHRAEDEGREDEGRHEGDRREVETRAGDEGAEEGEADEAGGADGEALADSGGGVTRGVEGVGLLADSLGHLGHLGNAAGVVADGAVDVDGEAGGEVGKHAERGEGDAVHVTEVEGEVDHDGEEADGEDGRLVSKREAVDDVGRRARLARLRNLADGLVGVGGVVLGDKADHAARPETRDGAAPSLGGGEVDDGSGDSFDLELGGEEDVGKDVDNHGEDDGGGAKLNLEHLLDVNLLLHGLDVGGNEGADQAHQDTTAGDGDREHEAGPATLSDEGAGLSGDDKRGTGGLGEGAEEIGAHTGDVTDVITDVVGDGGGVPWVVLGDAADNLTGEVGANVGSLGVDAAADAAEHGDRGSTESKARDALEELDSLDGDVERGDVHAHEEVHDDDSEAGEGEAHDGSSPEGRVEGFLPRERVGGLGGAHGAPGVGEHGDHHSNVAADHGGDAADEEGEGGESADLEVPAGLNLGDEEDHRDAEDCEEGEAHPVLRRQESLRAGLDVAVDLTELLIRVGLGLTSVGHLHAPEERLIVLPALPEQRDLAQLLVQPVREHDAERRGRDDQQAAHQIRQKVLRHQTSLIQVNETTRRLVTIA
mmetsp:Transcript_3506/g.15455  ORF Transcript_3506/g.15455 Transcript_3506/m.15455 type:complete len:639 (-) Transcript_3506:48-1964(-)